MTSNPFSIFSRQPGKFAHEFWLQLAFANKLPPEQKAATEELAFQMFGGSK